MKLYWLLSICLMLPCVASESMEYNITTSTFYYDCSDKIECAQCGKDITEEDFELVTYAQKGPIMFFVCDKCSKELEKLLVMYQDTK